MEDLPHHYSASSRARPEGDVVLETEGVSAIASGAPVEFGGEGGRWSPETLLVAAVVDCFSLSFRAIARASRLDWSELSARAEGKLDRIERSMRFTEIVVRASLRVPAGTDEAKARRLLEKAEQTCLVTNSLSAARRLEAEVEVEAGS